MNSTPNPTLLLRLSQLLCVCLLSFLAACGGGGGDGAAGVASAGGDDAAYADGAGGDLSEDGGAAVTAAAGIDDASSLVVDTNIAPADEAVLAAAIRSGSFSSDVADPTAAPRRLLATLRSHADNQNAFYQQIYGGQRIDYAPSVYSQYIHPYGIAGGYALLIGRSSDGVKLGQLAAAAERGERRFAAFGDNVLAQLEQRYSGYQGPMRNTLAWLLRRQPGQMTNLTVRFVQVKTEAFSASRDWLQNNFSGWDIAPCDDALDPGACLAAADLVVAGAAPALAGAARDAVMSFLNSASTPILYVHHFNSRSGQWAGDNDLLRLMGMRHDPAASRGNRFDPVSANWDNYQQMLAAAPDQNKFIESLLKRLASGQFDFSLNNCDESTCAGNDFNRQFVVAAEKIRGYLGSLAANRIDPFAANSLANDEATRMLILLGDYYRSRISYPINNRVDSRQEFLEALFADYTAFDYRKVNPAQPDLGSFSNNDFSNVPVVSSKEIDYISVNRNSAAGVYAIPGRTMTVTRLDDNSDLTVKVYINTLRSGSSKLYSSSVNKPAYTRPRFLQSRQFPIAPGETIELTSAYGGPVQLYFNKADVPARLRFENVGEHAFWKSSADSQRFATALNDGYFNWVEIVTPTFQVHTTLEKMTRTLTNTPWRDIDSLAAAIMRYHHDFPNALAGRQGEGITPIAEVEAIINQRGWSKRTLDTVLHGNADQAACGAACSGNPYDSWGYFNPLGHGGLHELGHSLQSFLLDGFSLHASTNFYSYYSKSRYHAITGDSPSCQSNIRWQQMRAALEQSRRSSNPFNYMRGLGWTEWKEGVGIVIQMLMATQQAGLLDNGWHLIPLIHVLQYNMNTALKNEQTWLQQRDSFGFSTYSRSEAQNVGRGNDFLLVAFGSLTGRDYSNLFTMWGLPLSNKAKAQVAALPDMPMNYFVVSGGDYCLGLDKPAVAVQ